MTPKPLYQREFNDYPELNVTLPDGYEDQSWHNDVCPSFARKDAVFGYLIIYVDYPDKALRQLHNEGRFMCVRYETEGDIGTEQCEDFETDDWVDVINWAETHRSKT